jgi:hypothetical protein
VATEEAQAQTREELEGMEGAEERTAEKRANRAAQRVKRRAELDEAERAAAVLPEALPPRRAATRPAKVAKPTAAVADRDAP